MKARARAAGCRPTGLQRWFQRHRSTVWTQGSKPLPCHLKEPCHDPSCRDRRHLRPDPGDGRAKIIRLTTEGEAAQATARLLFDEIERRWAERYGAERVAALRELIEEIRADQREPATSVGA